MLDRNGEGHGKNSQYSGKNTLMNVSEQECVVVRSCSQAKVKL